MKFRNHHAGCCGFNPTRADGTEWPRILTLPDGSTVHADTATEVLEELVDGYAEADPVGRERLRRLHAASAAQAVQHRLLVGAGVRDDDPVAELMLADKDQSLLLETDDAPGRQADWWGEPALVLVTTSYAPHGVHPPIGGHVVWLDPTTEDAYLRSLRDAGAYDYWEA